MRTNDKLIETLCKLREETTRAYGALVRWESSPDIGNQVKHLRHRLHLILLDLDGIFSALEGSEEENT